MAELSPREQKKIRALLEATYGGRGHQVAQNSQPPPRASAAPPPPPPSRSRFKPRRYASGPLMPGTNIQGSKPSGVIFDEAAIFPGIGLEDHVIYEEDEP